MKKKLLFLCLLLSLAFTKGYAQQVHGEILKVPTTDRKSVTVDMYDKDCMHVVDGLIASAEEIVPQSQLAHFERAVSEEKLAKFGFSEGQCIMVKSSADLEIENYVYRKMHEQVQQIGTKYKIPIVVNGKLTPSYTDRRHLLSNIKTEQIKKIKFLNKAEAQAKYGNKVIFGLIEITV